MPLVSSEGVGISYEVLNSSSPNLPIFFIAGLAGTRQGLLGQAIPFSAERPVVLHDHRGTGDSEKPRRVYTIENMAKDIVHIMEDAGISKAHFVGTSTGGAIIQHLCLDHKSKVQTAAICCSWPTTDSFFKRQFEMRKLVLLNLGTKAATQLSSTTLYDPKFFSENYEDILERETSHISRAATPEVDAERIDAIIKHDQLARLPEIDVPVLVVCAKNDAVCPPYFSQQIADAIPGSRLLLYEDDGHFFFISNPERFNNDIRNFINQHE